MRRLHDPAAWFLTDDQRTHCDVEGDVQERRSVWMPRYLQPLDRRQPAVGISSQLCAHTHAQSVDSKVAEARPSAGDAVAELREHASWMCRPHRQTRHAQRRGPAAHGSASDPLSVGQRLGKRGTCIARSSSSRMDSDTSTPFSSATFLTCQAQCDGSDRWQSQVLGADHPGRRGSSAAAACQ